ncbi:hypothetical protein [Mariniflexile sp.]|uniref:hypothetical protein n=1 Tax=Mariniflexile sp. TaxID=1979402 RepID=UPI004048A5AF
MHQSPLYIVLPLAIAQHLAAYCLDSKWMDATTLFQSFFYTPSLMVLAGKNLKK